jgi:GntR family transcriptional repressor for pyruvate dehydrogenase complex
MAQLAVGRSSLREAIKVLSGIGVIRVVRGGMFVGGGDASILSKPFAWALLLGERSTREVVEARRAVETELAALAADRATSEALATIEAHLTGLHDSIDDPESYARHDLAFHMAIAHAADNRVLSHLLETLRNLVGVWIEKAIAGNKGKPRSYEEHIPIFEAIRSRDPEAARRAMAVHLDAAALRLLETF